MQCFTGSPSMRHWFPGVIVKNTRRKIVLSAAKGTRPEPWDYVADGLIVERERDLRETLEQRSSEGLLVAL